MKACLISLGKSLCSDCGKEGRKTDACASMISYPNYKFIFPIKALGLYAKRFGDEPLL